MKSIGVPQTKRWTNLFSGQSVRVAGDRAYVLFNAGIRGLEAFDLTAQVQRRGTEEVKARYQPAADEQLLVDIDLAILGADTARFAEYQTQIRREYAHVPATAAPGEARCSRRFSPAIRSTARRGCATPSRPAATW